MDQDLIKFQIAEDEPAVRSLLRNVLHEQEYYDILMASDGLEAFQQMERTAPDILITDLKMPRLDGEELARKALHLHPDITILVTTGNGTIENAVQLMKDGVFDFITKPFSIETLNLSIERGVNRTRKLFELNGVRDVVEVLMAALESKDIYLKGHSRRVSRLCGFIARKLQWPQKRTRLLEYAALVHDIGKIGIREEVLNKPGPLDAEELIQMKKHPVHSRDILRPVAYLQKVLKDVYHHHERYDGGGYPDGLKGEAIPIGARIIAICDAFDAMSSDRSYRAAMSEEEILSILRRMQGTQFDPELVDLFLSNYSEISEIHIKDLLEAHA